MSLSCTNFPPVGVCNAAPETSMGSDPTESEENQMVEFRPSPLACIRTVSVSLCVWPGFFRGAVEGLERIPMEASPRALCLVLLFALSTSDYPTPVWEEAVGRKESCLLHAFAPCLFEFVQSYCLSVWLI